MLPGNPKKFPGGGSNAGSSGEAMPGARNGAGQAVRARPATRSVVSENRSGVAEGKQFGDRGPVAGGAGGDRAGGPAEQVQGKLAAAEPVGGVHVEGAADDLVGVLAAAPLRGAPVPLFDGCRRP